MGLADRDYMHERHRQRQKLEDAFYDPKAFRGNQARSRRKVDMSDWRPAAAPEMRIALPCIALARTIGLWILIGLLLAGAYQFFQKEPSPPLLLPENGSMTTYSTLPAHLPSGPFEISVTPGAADSHYFITISEWSTSAPMTGIFVRSGETVKTRLPIGVYRITIAEGKDWYGPQRLFGKKTLVKEGIHPVSIYAEQAYGSTRIRGFGLQLPGSVAGGFPTKEVPQ